MNFLDLPRQIEVTSPQPQPQSCGSTSCLEPYEVNYAAKAMGTSPAQIHKAIDAVGPSRAKVGKFVKQAQAKK